MSALRPSGRARRCYCEGGGGSSAGGVVVSGGGVVGDVVSEGGGGIVLVSGDAGASAGGGGAAVSSVVESLGLHPASMSAPIASTASDWNRFILWFLQVRTTN